MVHQLLDDRTGHVLHDVTVDYGGDDGDGDDVAALIDNAPNLFIFDTDYVLTVDLQQIVVDQQPVAGGRGIHGNGGDPPVLELESNVTGGILQRLVKHKIIRSKVLSHFVKSKSPLEGSVSDDHDDIVDGSLP